MLVKQITAKRAWAELSAKTRQAEKSVDELQRENAKLIKIACIGLQIQAGLITRTQAENLFNQLGVTREDLVKFRSWRSPATSPGPSASSAPSSSARSS